MIEKKMVDVTSKVDLLSMITNYVWCFKIIFNTSNFIFQILQEQSCPQFMFIGGTNGFPMMRRYLSTSNNLCYQNLMYNLPFLTQFKYGLYWKLLYVIWNKLLDLNYVVRSYHLSWNHGMYNKKVECTMNKFNNN